MSIGRDLAFSLLRSRSVHEFPIARTNEIDDKGCLGSPLFLLPEIDLRCCRRLAEIFPCQPDTERRWSAMLDPAATSAAIAESQSGAPPTYRLVIRVKMTREESPEVPVRRG